MKDGTSDLPQHDVVAGLTRALEICSLVAAMAMVAANAHHVFVAGLWRRWWSLFIAQLLHRHRLV